MQISPDRACVVPYIMQTMPRSTAECSCHHQRIASRSLPRASTPPRPQCPLQVLDTFHTIATRGPEVDALFDALQAHTTHLLSSKHVSGSYRQAAALGALRALAHYSRADPVLANKCLAATSKLPAQRDAWGALDPHVYVQLAMLTLDWPSLAVQEAGRPRPKLKRRGRGRGRDGADGDESSDADVSSPDASSGTGDSVAAAQERTLRMLRHKRRLEADVIQLWQEATSGQPPSPGEASAAVTAATAALRAGAWIHPAAVGKLVQALVALGGQ